MDNLPPECLTNILSFLPIADVFVCRSVCGKWKGAADSVVRGLKALKFYVVDTNKRTGKRDGIVLRQSKNALRSDDQTPLSLRGCWRTRPNGRNIGFWIKRLERMVRLKKLSVVFALVELPLRFFKFSHPLKSLLNAVIMRNASTLTTIDCHLLPFDPEHKSTHEHAVLVYGKLQNLICDMLTPAAAAACPRLVRLEVSRPVTAEALQNLPHETMQHLRADPDAQEPQEIETFIATVSRMTQLKELKLAEMRCDTSLINPDLLFIELFSNLKQLEKIDIWFPSKMSGTVDRAIDRLVRSNPRLTHIRFTDASATAASLVSLSRLTALQRLTLWLIGTNKPEPTTDDILTLLRGGSRQVLQYVRVDMRSRPDQERIEAEVKIMEREMGCIFSVTSDAWRSCVVIKRRKDDGDDDDSDDDDSDDD